MNNDGVMKRSLYLYPVPAAVGDHHYLRFSWNNSALNMAQVSELALTARLYPKGVPFDATVYPYHTLVCYHGARLVSIVSIISFEISTSTGCVPALYIALIATDPEYERRGIASKMLDACYEAFRTPNEAQRICYAFTQIADTRRAKKCASPSKTPFHRLI